MVDMWKQAFPWTTYRPGFTTLVSCRMEKERFTNL